MSEIFRLGKVKIETSIANFSYRIVDGKAGNATYKIAVAEFDLQRPINPGPEAKEFVRLFKAFVKEFMPEEYDILAISGRGPIWLYGMIVHELVHIVRSLAVFDPKLNGVVIVATHYGESLEPGDVVALEKKEAAKMTQ